MIIISKNLALLLDKTPFTKQLAYSIVLQEKKEFLVYFKVPAGADGVV